MKKKNKPTKARVRDSGEASETAARVAATGPAPILRHNGCLACGEPWCGATFWDASDIPLCREHLDSMRPLIERMVNMDSPGQLNARRAWESEKTALQKKLIEQDKFLTFAAAITHAVDVYRDDVEEDDGDYDFGPFTSP